MDFDIKGLLSKKNPVRTFQKFSPLTVFLSLNFNVRPAHGFEFHMPALNLHQNLLNNNNAIFQAFIFLT
jgi:hypothetical protein